MLLPLEVLEIIAFLIATEDTSIARLNNLIPLLLLDRETSKFLSFDSNHPLYARIYATKFDTKTTTRRLGKERLTAHGLAEELKKRCVHLRAIRTLSFELELIRPAIWTAFVMMLENDGKNERLLLEHAQIAHWLKHYWVAISNALEGEGWPSNNLFHSICMWLLCKFYPKGEWRIFNKNLPRECTNDQYPGNYGQDTLIVLVNAMKLFAVGAHCYPIGHLSWTDYAPRESADDPPSYEMTLYGEQVKLTPLPIAVPATISYLGIAEMLENKDELSVVGNNLGDTEWNRVFGLINNDLSKVHTIGSLEGVWEGVFTVSCISPLWFTNGVPRYLTVMDSTRISRHTMPSFRDRVQALWFIPLSRATVRRSRHGNTSFSNPLYSPWEIPYTRSYRRNLRSKRRYRESR